MLLACGVAWACDGEQDERAAARSAICNAYCGAVRACRPVVSSCESNCFADYDPPGIRPAALEAVADCLPTRSCAELDGEQPFSACFDQYEEHPILTPPLIDYCESAALHYFECDTWWSVDECTHAMSIFSDETLIDAQRCHTFDCERLRSCEANVFGGGE